MRPAGGSHHARPCAALLTHAPPAATGQPFREYLVLGYRDKWMVRWFFDQLGIFNVIVCDAAPSSLGLSVVD